MEWNEITNDRRWATITTAVAGDDLSWHGDEECCNKVVRATKSVLGVLRMVPCISLHLLNYNFLNTYITGI